MLDVNEVYSLLERSSLRGDQAAMTTLQAMGGGNQALESKGFASALATIISQGQQQQEQQADMGNDAGRQEVRLMASILLKNLVDKMYMSRGSSNNCIGLTFLAPSLVSPYILPWLTPFIS